MKRPVDPPENKHERVIFSLPKSLVEDVRRYAAVAHGGNKSSFVATAIRSYIDQLRKRRHTARMREAYAAAAGQGRTVAEEWKSLDEEVWAKLDETESRATRGA
jgi:metal-responsive CopG/Arc/MetJ family transcriptional regulator